MIGAQRYVGLQDYFTDADQIRTLMVQLLGDTTAKNILEPCAGEGAFIKDLIGHPAAVDAVELHAPYVDSLRRNFTSSVRVIHQDFIELFVSPPILRPSILLPNYDGVICNPPYGLKIDIPYRREIKKAYPGVYARESYGLFIHFSLDLLKKGGRYVYIVPDTFLFSRNHRELRVKLVKQGAPTHIIQFPSSRFQSVNFGYSNLCIIAGNARRLEPTDNVRWVDATHSTYDLSINAFEKGDLIQGKTLIDNSRDGWFHPNKEKSLGFFKGSTQLGMLAECRTGIYTGDNTKFLGYDENDPPIRTNGHPINWQRMVKREALSSDEKDTGIKGGPYYVPFIRGGHRKLFEKTKWAINWSEDAVKHYATDTKARLQNKSFYFREGIAVPMVTSGRLSASLMNDAIFDQGVVGIFPHNPDHLYFLLLYLNTGYVSHLKQAINSSANNSANYLKRLPVPKINSYTIRESQKLFGKAVKNGFDKISEECENLILRILC